MLLDNRTENLVKKGEIDEVDRLKLVDGLEEVAEGRELFRRIEDLFDLSGGKLLTKKELDLLKDFLWQKIQSKSEISGCWSCFKNKEGYFKKWKKITKLEDWNNRRVLGSFSQGPPPQLFLRSNNASELTVFHEIVHLKYWFNKSPKIHRIQEEVVVFEEIWKTKKRWTNRELLDSYYYVVSELKKYDLTKDLERFNDTYKAEIRQIELKMQYGIKWYILKNKLLRKPFKLWIL